MSMKEQIEKDVKENKIVIYMKGEKDAPMCGFSSRAVEIIKSYEKPFKAVNIFSDREIKPELVKFSNWPTTPQLFVDGKLVGGCDIIVELHERGELKTMLEG